MIHLIHIRLLVTATAWVLIIGCASSDVFVPPQPPPHDDQHIEPPVSRDINPEAEYFEKTITQQVKEALNLSRGVRIITGNRKHAYNVDAFGEIFPSTWFTNRHHLHPLSLSELRRGPNTGDGPDTENTWIITRAKSQGVTPGFSIKDSRGDNYVIKFDPKGYAELASGAEVVSTKLFHAMGYNTPENFVVYFHPDILKLGDKVKFTDESGTKRLMEEADLERLFEKIEFLPDGRIRALASKYLSGKPLGPFRYAGTRKDDPNDIIPHHHRRELRGLRIIAAWLNHFDTKDGNTLDMFVEEDGREFVRHYLIDFGATLGSASWGPNHMYRGHENDFDFNRILLNLFTLGLYVHPWEKQQPVIYPSIGLYESKLFDPEGYKPQVPNPAFENMTNLDGYWAAKVVTSFSDDDLAAIVKEGQYSDPQAASYLLETLKQRRDTIGRLYLSKVNCLDHFEVKQIASGDVHLSFVDLAVERGLVAAGAHEYRYQVLTAADKNPQWHAVGSDTEIKLENHAVSGDASQWTVRLAINRNASGWGKTVDVILHQMNDGTVTLRGIKRQN